MKYLSKAANILKRGGPVALLKKTIPFVHNTYIAPQLPRVGCTYNGVEVNAARRFDSVLPWRDPDDPHYESGLISGLEKYVNERNKVVIVGGGWGVTAVKAAQNVGDSGKVVVYEGSKNYANYIQETVEKNNIAEKVDIIHGIVGPKIHLYDESRGAPRVSPEEIPECDVLVLDCEGAEIEILKNIMIRPMVILVESHGIYDAPSSKVKRLLNSLSYSVRSKEIARRTSDFCYENDIYSLVAVRE